MPFDLIKYGAIGLAALLALMSFWLLRGEQAQPTIRSDMIRAIRTYMAFATILTVIGFGMELYRAFVAVADSKILDEKIASLTSENQNLNKKIADYKTSLTAVAALADEKTLLAKNSECTNCFAQSAAALVKILKEVAANDLISYTPPQ